MLDALELMSMGGLDSALKSAVIIVDQQVSLDIRILHDMGNDINLIVEVVVFHVLLCSQDHLRVWIQDELPACCAIWQCQMRF